MPDADATAVMDEAGLAPAEVAVIEVTGSGAVSCVQGLLTNDVERPGEGSFVYGAVLTPKGMILSDLWALRHGAAVRLVVPAAGKAVVEEVLRKALPPRLARAAERPELTVWRLAGPRSFEVARAAGLDVPEPGRSSTTLLEGTPVLAARPRAAAFFELELHASAEQAPVLVEVLEQAGARKVVARALEITRILMGWPRLGVEIDQKTLPQEVRFDELEGVSYTKGCYTGQETVARVHFRGHVNRVLGGVSWRTRPEPGSSSVVLQDGREIGYVTSAAWVAPLEKFVGLAKVRRDYDRKKIATACGAPAYIVGLPFSTIG